MDDKPLEGDKKEEVKQDPSDTLTPDHPRFKEVIAEKNELKNEVENLRSELSEVKEQIAARQEQTGEDELTSDEQVALERIERNLKAKGYVKKEDMQSELRVERKAREYERLSEKYDGKNGLPKFVADDVAIYAKRHGFDDLERAYKDMHFDVRVELEAKRRLEGKNPPTSEQPTGGDRDGDKERLTGDDISNMSDAEYEEKRADLLSSIKPKK